MQTKEASEQFFTEIIQAHQGLLYKVARVYCPQEEERQDLMQEIALQVWKALPKYKPQYKLSTWLYRIALNVAISSYRKQTTQQNQCGKFNPELDQEDTSEEKAKHEAQLKLLERFIAELQELDKALMLLYLEDKSHAEIAEILGLSVSNVGTKVARIKEKLRIRFSQL
jgi:RNA polymerase sigma-70 factor (ECF subfamily)